MEELKIVMEALSKMSDGASTAFIVWCIKEVLVTLMWPISVGVIGFSIYKTVYSVCSINLDYGNDVKEHGDK